jgi:hypothetical protein
MNQFPNNMTTFKDTYGRGRINVHGWTLEADADGFIEAPSDLAREIEPHGFVRMARPVKQATTLGVPGRR